MTTDINNVQMSFMMCIRIAVRAPLMFLFAIIMAYIMGGALATTFLIIIPVLVIGLLLIARKAMPAFRAVFRKYDKLNESVEENVRAMRVVKGFAREGYEKQKFAAASHDIAKDFTFAERVVALNAPLMQFCVYFNMIFVLFVGSRIIITNGGTTIDVGQLSAMLTYGMQILMSLMMISMIYVMMTMSYESFVRICEVLEEEPALTDPASPAMDVKDGSIDFENVSFKYSAQAKKFALQDINLHIDSGMTVGILGGTGSSKTTLIQLISRLYDTTEGSVRVGGVDVRDYDMETLRNSAMCANTTLRRCAARSASCCKRMCCFPARSRITCAGATKTPPTTRWSRRAGSRRRTNSSAPSPTGMTPISSRAARTSPADRSSVSASPGRFSKSRRF